MSNYVPSRLEYGLAVRIIGTIGRAIFALAYHRHHPASDRASNWWRQQSGLDGAWYDCPILEACTLGSLRLEGKGATARRRPFSGLMADELLAYRDAKSKRAASPLLGVVEVNDGAMAEWMGPRKTHEAREVMGCLAARDPCSARETREFIAWLAARSLACTLHARSAGMSAAHPPLASRRRRADLLIPRNHKQLAGPRP